MDWFFIAFLSTLCFSIISHIDKYILSRYLKGSGVGALMLFSALFAILILPFIYLLEERVLSISINDSLFLIGVGILSFIAVFFYFKALSYTEASVAVPFFQLIPIFGFILGFILLGEVVSVKSILAGLIIISGILLLSFSKKEEGEILFKGKVVVLMLGSSFTYALYEVLFKLVTIKETFWISLFWQNIGLLITGLFLYIFIKSYRQDFHKLISNNGLGILSLNLLNETLNTLAVGLIQYASLLVPIVLVFLVNSLQPAIVFILGILLTLFLPKISKEDIKRSTLIQKTIAILIVTFGTYLLYF